MRRFYRAWAEVDVTAVSANLAEIRAALNRKCGVIAVVKADGYGHGLKQIALEMMGSRVDGFGVANLAEARVIRALDRDWPILMLGACLEEEVEAAIEEGVIPIVSTLEEAEAFSRVAVRMNRSVAVDVKVDTGMGRLGVDPSDVDAVVHGICRLPGLLLRGVCTHYAAAEDDSDFSRAQADRFDRALGAIRDFGITIPTVHAANSAALLYEPKQAHDTVRPGLLLYGVSPRGRRKPANTLADRLRPALGWKCRVSLVKWIPKGKPLSYGHTFFSPRPMRVATITVGYGDGYLRAASNRAEVLIRGKRCRILGRVTMDQAIVDVTHVPDVDRGDEVVLIGSQGKERILAEDLADWSGTIPWEVLTNITQRVPRLYNSKGASLPEKP